MGTHLRVRSKGVQLGFEFLLPKISINHHHLPTVLIHESSNASNLPIFEKFEYLAHREPKACSMRSQHGFWAKPQFSEGEGVCIV